LWGVINNFRIVFDSGHIPCVISETGSVLWLDFKDIPDVFNICFGFADFDTRPISFFLNAINRQAGTVSPEMIRAGKAGAVSPSIIFKTAGGE
jgi:hypothetical protein